jgi:hypothetical protein
MCYILISTDLLILFGITMDCRNGRWNPLFYVCNKGDKTEGRHSYRLHAVLLSRLTV